MTIKEFINKRKTVKNANVFLFVLIISVIIIAPLFPKQYHSVVFSTLLVLIYITSVVSIKQKRSKLYAAAMTMIILQPLSGIFNMEIINLIARLLNVGFFLLIVFLIVVDVAHSKTVDRKTIFEAINVYLLIGIVFALLITVLMMINPNSFSFPFRDQLQGKPSTHFSEYIYYGFVTFTTLGYGEIVPLTPFARSLAVLAAVTGPIYLAVVIAMLVGKFSSK
jgi:voltage-gated potassium channel Kch